MEDSASNTVKDGGLVKLKDDGQTNNYSEFEYKAKLRLIALDYWKYIEGPESTPPLIPKLKAQQQVKGIGPDGKEISVIIRGNEAEVQTATQKAQPWMAANAKVLSLIADSLPHSKLYLTKRSTFAKQAWEALKSEYRPVNSMRATQLKQQLITYIPAPGYGTVKWREDMLRMFIDLTDLDSNLMSDQEFARHLVTMMRKDGEWRYTASQLADEMAKAEMLGKPLPSKYVLERLKAEDERQNNPENSTSVLMTARAEYNAKLKRTRDEPTVAYTSGSASTSPSPLGYKRPREQYAQPHQSKICSNDFCEKPIGHLAADCFTYKGGKQGQYPEWYRGPRFIHLSPLQRAKVKRDELLKKATQNQTTSQVNSRTHAASANITTDDTSRSSIEEISTTDSEETALANLTQPELILNTVALDTACHCSSTAFNTTIAKDTSVFHNSGATRHVFHDISLFHSYEPLTVPIRVNGFGSELSATAPGTGTVRLAAEKRTLVLTNVLYVPSSRVNLVSGSELDKKGIAAWTANGRISLYNGATLIAKGTLSGDLYKLQVTAIPSTSSLPLQAAATPTSSLVNRLQSRPLAKRLEPNTSTMTLALNTMNDCTKSDFCTV